MSDHRLLALVSIVILSVVLRVLPSEAATTDTGDPVYYTGPNTIDAANLTVSGVPVSLAGASGSEYAAARLATTGNITLSGEQTIDGVLTAGSAVVVWLQTNAAQNGLYVSGTGGWLRRNDLDISAEFAGNKSVFVTSGVRYAGTVFRVANTGTVTLGTTDVSLIPESAQWHVSPLQPIAAGGTISCTSPAGQYVGVSTTVIGVGGSVALGVPQIAACTRTNQLCRIKGTSDLNPVEMRDGDGVLLAQATDPVVLDARSTITLECSGTLLWRQVDQLGVGGGGGTSSATLQSACDAGVTCGWTNLTQTRPLRFRGTPTGPYEDLYELGGNFVRERKNADGTPASPEVIRLRADHLLSVQALMGTPASWQDVATIENVGGVTIETTGLFARPIATEVEVSPTATLLQTNVQSALEFLSTNSPAMMLTMGACGLASNPIFSDTSGTSLEFCVDAGSPVMRPTCTGVVCSRTAFTNLVLRSEGTKPTCNATYATAQTMPLWVTTGGAGVATTLEVCSKNAANVYAWRSITLP